MAKPRKHHSSSSSSNSSWLSTCVCSSLAILLLLAMAYSFLHIDPDRLHHALGSFSQASSSAGNNILLKMRSSRFNSAHQEIVEENQAVVSFKDNQVFVSCPPCNTSSPLGLYSVRDVPGLQIQPVHSPAEFSILLAIFNSDASKFHHRSLLRLAYSVQRASTAIIDVLFVLASPKTDEERILLHLEMRQFNDIVLVDSEDVTKVTHTFLSKISAQPQLLRHDFVMKLEDDSYVRLSNLASSLANQPKRDLYYGFVLPCDNQDAYQSYMAGMGYVLSWDLVEWIGNSSTVRESKAEGHEDKLLADWLNEGGKAKNRVNKKPFFYDHPDHGGNCAHEVVPETILVHQLTNMKRWVDVLSFFEPNLASSL